MLISANGIGGDVMPISANGIGGYAMPVQSLLFESVHFFNACVGACEVYSLSIGL